MRIYLWVVLLLGVIVTVFGAVGPMLFSAGSTEAVLLGIALVGSAIPILFLIVKSIVMAVKDTKIKKEAKNEKND